jgi:adenylate cyclase class 1
LTQHFAPISLGAPGEEISKKDLIAVVQRFKYFHQQRLQRLQNFLQPRQLEFLQLLPLLFHVNHPALPGFVSLSAPAGVSDYQPDKTTLSAAKQFAKTFVYNQTGSPAAQIYSLFLMGSVGSVAFSKHSDIDIWLCHQPDLSPKALTLLQNKALAVEKWAADLRIEVHFFLINADQFKCGVHAPLSADSSGDTQHYLLLEEFYRTAIYVAGRYPVWWLVPAEYEQSYPDYVRHLLAKRFISEQTVIDFGGLQQMPESEFISAALWQIYKSLKAPHKSLLKLWLMESYADSYPQPRWLSRQLKRAIYQGEFSVDSLDPYSLIYQQVESYLRGLNKPQHLNLARECFYLKIMGVRESELDDGTRQFRSRYLREMAERWRWPADLLDNIGNRQYWMLEKACMEHQIIREQLQDCLGMMLKLTSVHTLERGPLEHPELKLINRKLRAALDVTPGKVEVLTTRGMIQDAPSVLILREHDRDEEEASVWELCREHEAGVATKITQSGNLIELICWLVLNGISQHSYKFKLSSVRLPLNVTELQALLNLIGEFLNRLRPDKEPDLSVYTQANRFCGALLLVNLAGRQAREANERVVIGIRSDPFSYGEHGGSLVETAVKISVTSWGEVWVREYNGFTEFLECMLEAFNKSAAPRRAESLQVHCYTQALAKSINARIQQFFKQLLDCFDDAVERKPRYLFAADGGYYLCFFSDNLVKFKRLDNQQQLLRELGAAQAVFTPVVFGDWVLEQSFIPLLYRRAQAGLIRVFYYASAKTLTVYVIDEKGSLFIAQHPKASAGQVLTDYMRFLKYLLAQAKLPAATGVDCLEIIKPAGGAVRIQPADVNPPGDATVNPALADAPCRLLGVEDASQLQTVHFLRYKLKVESG